MLRPHRADGRVPVPAPQCSRTTRSKLPFGNNAVCSYAAVQPLRQERHLPEVLEPLTRLHFGQIS